MKKSLLPIFACLFYLSAVNAQVFWTDDFTNTTPSSGVRNATNHTNSTDGSDHTTCGTGNYFFRTNLASDPGNGMNAIFTNISNSHYWRGEDILDCISNPDVINYTGIDITSRTNLGFRGLFGIRDIASWESTDELRVEYQIDGGGYTVILAFEPDVTNSHLALDTNNDGVGDGTPLSTALATFTAAIAGTGTTLDIRFTANVDGGGEEFAIDLFQVEDNLPMPVDLISFTGSLENVGSVLDWKTASELDHHYFEIEHSVNGKIFTALDKVGGEGSAFEVTNYTYIHPNPNKGLNYYRLKQVDYDGQFSFSKVITIDNALKSRGISIFPNPFDQSLTLSIPDLGNQNITYSEYSIEVYDVFGRLVHHISTPKSVSEYDLDLGHIQCGNYFIKVFDKDDLVGTQRIQKQ